MLLRCCSVILYIALLRDCDEGDTLVHIAVVKAQLFTPRAGLICARDLIAMWCKSRVPCVQWLQHMLVCGVFATALRTARKGCLVVLSSCMAKQA